MELSTETTYPEFSITKFACPIYKRYNFHLQTCLCMVNYMQYHPSPLLLSYSLYITRFDSLIYKKYNFQLQTFLCMVHYMQYHPSPQLLSYSLYITRFDCLIYKKYNFQLQTFYVWSTTCSATPVHSSCRILCT